MLTAILHTLLVMCRSLAHGRSASSSKLVWAGPEGRVAGRDYTQDQPVS